MGKNCLVVWASYSDFMEKCEKIVFTETICHETFVVFLITYCFLDSYNPIQVRKAYGNLPLSVLSLPSADRKKNAKADFARCLKKGIYRDDAALGYLNVHLHKANKKSFPSGCCLTSGTPTKYCGTENPIPRETCNRRICPLSISVNKRTKIYSD